MLSILSLVLSFFDKIFGYAGTVDQDKTSLAVAQIESTAAVEEKWWFVSAMIPAFALPYALWLWKVIVWDKLIEGGHTTTDALTGNVGVGFNIVLGGIFMHSLVKAIW